MNEIIRRLQTTRSIPPDCLAAIDISTSPGRHAAFDILARNVALSFLDSRFTLPVGFDLMQQLVRLSNFDLSTYTWDIFEAFACGAYRTDFYPVDLDPAVQHTIPRLRKILDLRCGSLLARHIRLADANAQ
ncbi:hypothetical protein [Burkholderia pseudomultivorans]|uniref:Uncharacterized protein n=1 Tax=Burkholderia pseudomultivorans TaxID=1207504 RepID=A0ABU2E857_9BURK|nr:hypothetical protein [Burkholderia pseudomultivorans]MDR8727175.1 hypothetical protein [Burkholderia pseudomultivorans]MDR8732986.1 hypothetical protein [Burkholderia pseudomultivorans]MDR8739852.1 hypothetical protein [Burkholderia pseudomultivorans]MDR8756066.1 hypothetical protein [Burkholderia pseudomultivorans]MDR8775958.1 hypothetical protein [Burkholderia pseudomultivorans]